MFFRKFVAGMALSGFALSTALAAAPSSPPVIKAVTQMGMTVVSSFPAVSGLTGWVLQKDGQASLVFVTPDGKTLIAGALINAEGRNLTAEYGDKYMPQPDNAALYAELAKAPAIDIGKGGGRDVYVMFDPNCPFCHLVWKAMKPYSEAGAKVHWVPVGYLKADSMAKAAGLLAAKDKAAALTSLMESQGHVPAAPSDSTSESKVLKNNAMMRKNGWDGVPVIIYKDSRGKVIMRAGLPRVSELPAITGLPEQKIDDPNLAQFR